jgi:hypothetical protein
MIKKSHFVTRHWWLTPVILPTQEADIRRIVFQSQPGQIVPKTQSRKYSVPKRTGGVAQEVESLLSKY